MCKRLLQGFPALLLFTAAALAQAPNPVLSGTIHANQITDQLVLSQIPTGTGSTQVAVGNDARFGNATSLNGQVITGLTGPIKFTAGVASVMSASDIAGLFSGCNSSTPILSFNGTVGTCISSGGTGTVTSVGVTAPASLFSVGSPVTGSGNISLTFATGQTVNQVLGSDASGNISLHSITAAMVPAVNLAGTGNGGVTGLLPAASINGPITTTQLPTAAEVWYKTTIGHAALTAAALTQAITVTTLAARQSLCGLAVKNTTAFTGTFSALSLTVGDSTASPTFYSQNSFDLMQAVSNTAFQIVNVKGLANYAGSTVQANFTSTGANVSTQTAGSVDIDYCVLTLP